MILEVVTYPNKILKQISQEVSVFDEALHSFLDDMYDTMIAKNGIGLAAIQVGEAKRILIINMPDENDEQNKENLLEIINPVITFREGEEIHQEGCLSVPGFYEDIKRSKHIILEYVDRHNQKHTIETDDFLAVAIQHEMDHLDGKLFIEKLSILKRKKFEKEYKKLQKGKKKGEKTP